jgi:hypothetical protein
MASKTRGRSLDANFFKLSPSVELVLFDKNKPFAEEDFAARCRIVDGFDETCKRALAHSRRFAARVDLDAGAPCVESADGKRRLLLSPQHLFARQYRRSLFFVQNGAEPFALEELQELAGCLRVQVQADLGIAAAVNVIISL